MSANSPSSVQSLDVVTRPFTSKTLDRHVWALALPAIGENLLATALLIVDTLMISRFGSIPIAASAVAGVIVWRTHATIGCIEKGTTAMVARYYGQGDLEKTGCTVAQSIYLALAIGPLVSLFGILLTPSFLKWMGADADVVRAGAPFLAVLFAASIPRVFFFVASASLRGAGDTRTPMWIVLGMNLINIVFNYLLIFGHCGLPRLELTGSGISTALAISFASVAAWLIMWRGQTKFRLHARHFRPDFSIIRTILRISAPSLLEEVVISVGFLVFFGFIARMGTAILAAHRVTTTIESLSYMAGYGFSIATATLVGQALGMGRIDLARRSFRRATINCVLVMTAIAFGLAIFSRPMIEAFHPTDEVRKLARVLLLIAATEQPLLGIAGVLAGGLRGGGDTVSPMIISSFSNIVIRICVVYWLTFVLGWGIYGVYIGTVVDWIVRSLLLFYAYKRGRWARVAM